MIKEKAQKNYEKLFKEESLPGRPWVRVTRIDDFGIFSKHTGVTGEFQVEIPQFSLSIVRRAIRILFFGSEEGP